MLVVVGNNVAPDMWSVRAVAGSDGSDYKEVFFRLG